MFTHTRRTATALAVLSAAGLGGSALAGAASSSSSSSPNRSAPMAREALSADDAAKVKAAALEEVPGATVGRTEAGGPYPTPYHAHITTTDGTKQVVLVDAGFTATGVQADSRRGPRGAKGRPGPRLSADTAAKVKAAALEEVPGATVGHTEAGGPYPTPYHAHITTADGTRQVVLVDAGFNATGVQADPGPGGKRRGR